MVRIVDHALEILAVELELVAPGQAVQRVDDLLVAGERPGHACRDRVGHAPVVPEPAADPSRRRLNGAQAAGQLLPWRRREPPFAGVGDRAKAGGETAGFVKVVADKASGTVLGVRMVGPSVTDLVGEAVLAVETGAQVRDLALSIHPHPTLCEALMEAAEACEGRSVHQPKRRR